MKFAEKLDRVQSFAKPRVSRLHRLLGRQATNPRKDRRKRHQLHHILGAVVAGLLVNCNSLRDVEDLGGQFGLGRLGEGVSDTAIGHLPEKLDSSELLEVLVQRMQRPGHGKITEFVSFFEWLHQTYRRHRLIDVFDVNAGFTSLATIELVDSRGYGAVLKGNQPELRAFAMAELCGIAGR